MLALRRGKGMVLDAGDPDTRSAGSFFTNPVLSQARFGALEDRAGRFGPAVAVPRFPAADGQVKVPAAWLIERAGFARGYGSGAGVRISAKHPLALVNRGRRHAPKGLLALAARDPRRRACVVRDRAESRAGARRRHAAEPGAAQPGVDPGQQAGADRIGRDAAAHRHAGQLGQLGVTEAEDVCGPGRTGR